LADNIKSVKPETFERVNQLGDRSRQARGGRERQEGARRQHVSIGNGLPNYTDGAQTGESTGHDQSF
jgi:hypothetical protein